MDAKLGALPDPEAMLSEIYHQNEGLGIYCSAYITAEFTELVGHKEQTDNQP